MKTRVVFIIEQDQPIIVESVEQVLQEVEPVEISEAHSSVVIDGLQNAEPKKHPIEPEVRKHLEMLSEPYRSQAIKNAESLGMADQWFARLDTSPISYAINRSFAWENSPQGHDYWLGVYNRARSGEFDTSNESISDLFLVVKGGGQ